MPTTLEPSRTAPDIAAVMGTRDRVDRDVLALLDESLAHFESTGLHLSLDDLKAWQVAVKLNPSAQLPACHV